ncbi:MAG: zinc ABC transporter substrate-binding protein [Chloroflexi bacterium]|nr:zinc ABC transporter substrate-binding protein [Chloroflexota bacterium]MYF23499.1 zinc ABC transporter substrate-binding protein [Chloroflexota bacterium]
MSRLVKLALGALVALSLAAVLVVGCSDDDQSQQQQAQPQQQQESEAAAPAQSSAAQEQQQQQQAQPQAVSADPLKVVVSTQIIADWVRQIGGDHVEVEALVPAGADVHTLELSVSDIRAVAEADLVIINGAGLESAYEASILENSDHVLNLAEAIESAGLELAPFEGMMSEHGQEDEDDHAHEDEDEHEHEDEDHQQHEQDEHEHDHASAPTGRLLIADGSEAVLSVVDLMTEEVNYGAFSIATVGATVKHSPTHRYGIVLARGPEDDDDRVHIFDGGVFLVEHGDHYDLFVEPVSRHSLEIVEEAPIHYVNSYGWTAIFADASGHVILIHEESLTSAQGDYEPIVLEAGPHHGAALAISEEHVIVTTKNPDDPNDALPVGVEVRTFDDEVVYDDSNRACPGMHGEAHNAHGAAFGCVGGVLFLHAHEGEYEYTWIPNPPEMHEAARIGSVYGHHHLDHFFGSASYRGEAGWNSDGIWLIDAAFGTMTRVFDEGPLAVAIGNHGETLFLLGADAVLYALDAHDGEIIASAEMVGASESGRPGMIAVGEHLFITDPGDGHVLMVDGHSLEVVEEWHVGGAPGSLAFVGVLDGDDAPHAGHDEDEMHEDDHDQDEAHDHDEDEEHDDHGDEEDDHGHHHHHGDEDPHFWFDVDLTSVAIVAIADELSHLSPEAADTFSDRLELYLAEIAEADAEAQALLAGISDSQRLLVTFHDAFGYFARRYGLEVAGFVVEGPEQGVSAEALAELIELIEHEGVETVFHEPQFDSAILDTVADETGAKRGIIWSQPTEDNPTYIGILVGNARAIAEQ